MLRCHEDEMGILDEAVFQPINDKVLKLQRSVRSLKVGLFFGVFWVFFYTPEWFIHREMRKCTRMTTKAITAASM